MITIRTYMVGDKRAFKRIDKILADAPAIGRKTITELAKRTQISMKLRAPKDTGDLRRSISVRPVGMNSMEIITGSGLERPYDVYQDMGFRPHRVPVSKLKPSSIKLRGIIGKKKPRVITVRRADHKFFVDRTINEYLIPNTPRIVESVWRGFLRNIGG